MQTIIAAAILGRPPTAPDQQVVGAFGGRGARVTGVAGSASGDAGH